jgi:hypothetical protein
MKVECEVGRKLLEIRDAAIDFARDIVKAKSTTTSATFENRNSDAVYMQTVFKVHQPAFDYNEHLKVCDVCKVNRLFINRHPISIEETTHTA